MGMPVTIEIVDAAKEYDQEDAFKKVFSYFQYVDETFSTYKETSEITRINQGVIKENEYSDDMKEIFALSEETKNLTNGYFNIFAPDGKIDPSGIVKGWSIHNAAKILQSLGYKNFYVDVGGDTEVHGLNEHKEYWKIGIRDPFTKGRDIVKVIYLTDKGIATSGTYIRGLHIYNPNRGNVPADEIVSLTVIGPNIYEADRFTTAAFAMGEEGIRFIERLAGFEGCSIDHAGFATMTTGFEKYTHA